ncbi:shikimate dehydrogenase [Arthrobacter sp. H41]|uniref:shikimate dehydrogenase n=1 Tax=Arthrobacter sp. H41 TaxID=1312978 RepID=UPI0004790DD5|nr:shikimate dehydrogenase [Arthrobacter sp. H41]
MPAHTAGFRAAVIGQPITHSKSPALHSAAYRLLGVDCTYTAIDVPPEQLGPFLDGIRGEPGWRGLSVTMPHKAALTRLTNSNTPLVQALGVLNTATFSRTDDGVHVTGHNTDAAGVAGALSFSGVEAPARAVILGGGGTAAAAVAGLQLLGAARADVFVRSPERARGLADVGARLGIAVTVRPWSGAPHALAAADVVVSTLPPHAADPVAAEFSLAAELRRPAFPGTLLDVAYDPWPSALAAAWADAGGRVVPGLEMLLYQAVEQIRLFFPEAPEPGRDVINVMCDAVGAPRR